MTFEEMKNEIEKLSHETNEKFLDMSRVGKYETQQLADYIKGLKDLNASLSVRGNENE